MKIRFWKIIKTILEFPLRYIHKQFWKPTFRYSDKFNRLQIIFMYTPREEILNKVMDLVSFSKLEGDYLEFGVYKGDTFLQAFHFAQKNNLELMQFYAFDSFEGLPEIKGEDINEHNQFSKEEYYCSLEEFKKNILNKGVDFKKVHIVKGGYAKVLNRKLKKDLSLKKAAVIMIDCDLYESTVPVLNFITDYIQNGAIIIFDDWFCFKGDPNKGERRAFGEWLNKNPHIQATEFHKFGRLGNSFILHKSKS